MKNGKICVATLAAILLVLICVVSASSTADNVDTKSSIEKIQTFSGSIKHQGNVSDEIIKKALELAGEEWKCVGAYTVDFDTMDTLVTLKKGNKVTYIEVYIKERQEGKQEKNLFAREVEPKIIERSIDKETIYSKDETTKQEEAEVFKERGKVVSEVQLIETSAVIVEAWHGIEAENALGQTLWRLTAKGYFHVYPGDEVFYVADDSSAYANGYLGWNIDYFDSDATWTSAAGKVDARAGFDNVLPGVDDVDAWAWVQVDKDLYKTGDAGYN